VLLFHAELSAFAGGFVGVDVFFVISGYLITRNIRSAIEAGDWSFLGFYARRARRLLPALFSTIAVTFVAGACFLSPEHLANLGRATLCAVTSSSNVLFWIESGYFDDSARLKPLLHTWSLGVEEQFYLLWPAMIYGLAKLRARSAMMIGLLTVLVASLVAAQWMLPRDSAAAFFLTPFRMCEFALGALCLHLPDAERLSSSPWRFVRAAMAPLGLGLIGIAVMTFDAGTPFPGVSSMLPCLGAALCIAGGGRGLGARLLQLPLLAGLGTISYSVYLVHWPLMTLADYVATGPASPWRPAILLTASIVLGYLQFALIEQPLRYGREPTAARRPWRFAAALFACALGIASAGALAWGQDGWPWRSESELQRLSAALQTATRTRVERLNCIARGDCTAAPDSERVLVIGDSFAQDYLMVLASAYPEYRFEALIESGCPPLPDCVDPKWKPDKRVRCSHFRRKVHTRLDRGLGDYAAVVVGLRWRPLYYKQLPGFLKELEQSAARRILLVGAKARIAGGASKLVAVSSDLRSFAVLAAAATNRKQKERVGRVLARISRRSERTEFIDISQAQCKDTCGNLADDGHPIVYDNVHFTVEGAQYVGRRLRELRGGRL